jgi:4-hydroxy-tetrahydrodipicolinate synthase
MIGRHVSQLSGYAPALPTPFNDDDSIDREAFEHLCRLQIEAGATALVVCGTTGEASTLSPSEHHELISVAVKVARGEIPVIAGAGANSTAHAIELSRGAEAAGADALLSVVPYYNKPTQDGLYAHFREIVGATGLPVILYDVPSRTACALADQTVLRLAELPQIIGLKDASGDVARPARLRPHVGSQFRLLSGDDATALAYLSQGGNGCISVTSNVAPGLGRQMYLAHQQGNLACAQRLAAPLAELTTALFRESSPSPLKFALSCLGLMSSRVRLPLVEITEATQDELIAVLTRVGDEFSDYMIAPLPGSDSAMGRARPYEHGCAPMAAGHFRH